MTTTTIYYNKIANVWSDAPGSNYGGQMTMGYNDRWRGLVSFNVSSIDGFIINSATMYLFVSYSGSVYNHEVKRVTNNSWQQNSVNWNTQPSTTDINQTTVYIDDFNKWVSFDITKILKDEVGPLSNFSVKIFGIGASKGNSVNNAYIVVDNSQECLPLILSFDMA
jgi:hypothetical protein